jgi:uncharacterized repeat protein (TIGR03837 family)
MRWDIFCQIVDNYGDAGVCWRLARALSRPSPSSSLTLSLSLSHSLSDSLRDASSLASSHDDIRIRLFCDDLSVLNTIAHGDAVGYGATLGIEVLPWSAAESPDVLSSIGDVVIEAFACHLPETYVTAMTQRSVAPIWINLEYLTAEAWADDMHLMPSPQNNGLSKYFYFPGFTAKTGGVTLGNWDEAVDVLGASAAPPSLKTALAKCRNGAKRVSIFNYRHAPLDEWLHSLNTAALTNGDLVDVLICAGQNVSIATLTPALTAVQLIELPFVPQEDYDWLVAHCDMNLVRGEDSFVRAQWAGKPFIWDIYPQSDLAHEVKLNAFLERYFEDATPTLGSLGTSAMKWGSPTDWWPHLGAWTEHSAAWRQKLVGLGHLEGKILDFVKSQEISR